MTLDHKSPRTSFPLEALRTQLTEQVDGEVRFDSGSRATYSTDASNYRAVPLGVVIPRTPEDAATAVAVCRAHDVPVLSRGGGTSLAGQCCNAGVVIDWSKYCTRVVSVDRAAATVVVEPGIALDRLNDELSPTGLLVGPKPSTHVSCTIGGMIGNNSCGSTAQAYGKTVDAVRRLEIVTHDGLRAWVGPGDTIDTDDERGPELVARLRTIRDRYAEDIRKTYPAIPRRVSGYNLDSLLPENGFDLAKFLVGSESTLVTVLRAELELVRRPGAKAMAVLGFDDIYTAADAVPQVLRHTPAALEGLDHRLVALEHSLHLAEGAIRQLPAGNAWLMTQFDADTREDADRKAQAMIEEVCPRTGASATVLDDPEREAEIWAAREAGLGATAYPPDGPETHEGWEDAAVPPDRLGDYLRDFERLLQRFDYESSSLYGHFGHGCVHTRIPFDLRTATGIANYRAFVQESARLVVSYGGSLSGEHGDGQSRGELLPIMFGDRVIEAFGAVKRLFDPRNRMNPGKVIDPHPLDHDLRQGVDYRPWEPVTHFAFPEDSHRFSTAAARCVGVGKCRGDSGGVMCPSYRATREEEHSTRGRARILFEMLNGEVITDGWRSDEVRDALDLCLACKGCRSDCPVDVDMATYKAEFLSHHYRHRMRPLAHYSMGWIPLWARLGTSVAALANAVTHAPGLRHLIARAGGIDPRRGNAPVRFRPLHRNLPSRNRFRHRIAGARAAVAGHLHQQFRARHRAGGGHGAGGGRVHGGAARAGRVLRAHLDLDGPAPHREAGAAPHAADAGTAAARRDARRRPGTQLRRGIPLRPARTPARRRGRAPAGRADPHPGRTARRPRTRLDATPHRGRGTGTAALPPPRHPALRPRSGPAVGHRSRHRRARRRMLRPGRQFRIRAGPLRGVDRLRRGPAHARRARPRAGHPRPRRRLQLPHPDPPPRPRRRSPARGRTARRGDHPGIRLTRSAHTARHPG